MFLIAMLVGPAILGQQACQRLQGLGLPEVRVERLHEADRLGERGDRFGPAAESSQALADPEQRRPRHAARRRRMPRPAPESRRDPDGTRSRV
jgi:hypothetical protein